MGYHHIHAQQIQLPFEPKSMCCAPITIIVSNKWYSRHCWMPTMPHSYHAVLHKVTCKHTKHECCICPFFEQFHLSNASRSIFQILRFILGNTAFGIFGAGRFYNVYDVLLSGQLLWCHAYGIVTFRQMGTHRVTIVCTAGNCVVKIGSVAAGSVCKTFRWTVQGMRDSDHGHTSQWHSSAILREYLCSSMRVEVHTRTQMKIIFLLLLVAFIADVLPESGQHLSYSVDRTIDHSSTTSHHFIYGCRMA